VFNPFSKIKRISFLGFWWEITSRAVCFTPMDKLEKRDRTQDRQTIPKAAGYKTGGDLVSVTCPRAGCRRERILQQQQPEKSKEKEKSCRQKYKVCLCAE
jgi:hypothetical protein